MIRNLTLPSFAHLPTLPLTLTLTQTQTLTPTGTRTLPFGHQRRFLTNQNGTLFATKFLCREISPSLVHEALRENPNPNPNPNPNRNSGGPVDLNRARIEHNLYVNALRSCGLESIALKSDSYPDSVFIEDACVVVGKTVFITRPGAASRRGETEAVQALFQGPGKLKLTGFKVALCSEEGTIDGGDCLYTGRDLFVGLSYRTNVAGLQSLSAALTLTRTSVVPIEIGSSALHLKSACSAVTPTHILVGGSAGLDIQRQIERARPGRYQFTYVPDMLAANIVSVNGTLIRRTQEEYPESAAILDSLSGRQIQVPATEIGKVDGALTCCSVLI